MKQITRHFFQIKLGPVNAFVIEDKGLTLIDTGYHKDMHAIFAALKKSSKAPKDIKQIILTHCHPDHAGSAAAIKKSLNIPVYAHYVDAQLMEEGLSGRYPVERSPGLSNWLVYQLFIKGSPKKNEPFFVEEKLEDNDVLPIAGGLQALHTPGHSAGHIALLLKSEGLLIAGDICANVSGLGLSTVYENRKTGINSILKVADLDFETAVFGHGKPVMQDAAKKMKDTLCDLLI